MQALKSTILQSSISPTKPKYNAAIFDLSKFEDDEFNTDSYLHGLLSTSTEDEVRGFYDQLRVAQDRSATILQKNVYKNYGEFVLISKEISALESDMLLLRGYLTELRDANPNFQKTEAIMDKINTVQLTETVQESQKAEGGRIEESMSEFKKAQMDKVYDVIEGLKKMLPLSNTRSLIKDGFKPQFFELNPTTSKQKQAIHLFVLSDYLLVTTKKKSLISGKPKMTLEKFWKISEIAIIDMKDSETPTFKLMKHPENLLIKADSQENKRSLLDAVKKVTETLFAQKKKESEKAGVTGAKSAATEQPGSTNLEDTLFTATQVVEKPMVIKDNLTTSEVQFMTDLPYELDVMISLRDFDNSVISMVKAQNILENAGADTTRVQIIRSQLESRISTLANCITADIANPICTKRQTQANMDRLVKLGLGEQARDVFLQARSKIIRHRTRILKMDGDVVQYIADLADVIFQIIRNTCDWYNGSFDDKRMSSGFMKWIVKEIEFFGNIVRRHVFQDLKDFSTIATCLLHAITACEKLCRIGLDLGFLLDEIFHDDLSLAIDIHSSKGNQQILLLLAKDKFIPLETEKLTLADGFKDLLTADFKGISESVCGLYTILMDFGAEVGVLMNISLYSKIVSSLVNFFSVFLNKQLEIFGKNWKNEQNIVMITNFHFVIEELMPKVSRQLADRFERPIPEFEEQRSKLKALIKKMKADYIQQTSNSIFTSVFNFSTVDYSSGGGMIEQQKPSDAMLKFVGFLNKISLEMTPLYNKKSTITQILNIVFDHMINGKNTWENENGVPRRFGYGGVQQFFLDIHFFLKILALFISENSNANANTICEKALMLYLTQNPNMRARLKGGDWYEARVQAVVKQTSKNFPGL